MKTTRATACPDPEVLGAFAECRLGAWKRWRMTRHLNRCETCRDDVAALAELVVVPDLPPVPVPFRRLLAVAASLLTIVGAPILWWISQPPVRALVSASSRLGYRSVEARLSGGFDWAVFRDAERSSADDSSPIRQQLIGKAGEITEKANAHPADPRLQQAAAIGSLLMNDPRTAIERLTKLTTEHPDDAGAWSDLAAAHHAAAFRYGEAAAADEPLALAAADRALKLDPGLPEALFNRALIVEKLATAAQARQAWTKYLEVDSTSEWAKEARERRDALPATTNRSQVTRELQRLEPNTAAALVARFPEESRRYAETATMGGWAAAFAKGDEPEAQRQLTIARAIGKALHARSGEKLLADIVDAIDRANPADRARFASGYIAYTAAYNALKRAELSAARKEFLHAAALFGDSPPALYARYFAADASNRADDMETALREFREILTSIERRGEYKALRASVELGYGWAEGKQTRLSSAIEHLRLAASLFNALGERSSAASGSAMMAEAFSFLGRRDDAWSAWSAALHTFSEAGPENELFKCLNFAANAETLSGHHEAAMSLFDLAMQQHDAMAVSHPEILFRRAILSARSGETADAEVFIARGKAAAARIRDERARENTLADLDVAEGIAFSSSDPRRALSSLDRAVALREESRQVLLPATLEARSRVFRALGRSDEAMADLQEAIVVAESQRKPVEWRNTKSGALDGVEQIYTSLAELLLERGKPREAFLTADRAAAHAFYGPGATATVGSLDALQQRLGSNAVVVEYLILPAKTVIFIAGARTFETREIGIPRAEVAQRVDALDRALRDRAPEPDVQDASSRLAAVLIAPLRTLLPPETSITFVPDPLVAAVPFAALFDAQSRRWLIEDHTVRVVPSALYHDDSQHEPSSRVVVICPSAGDVDLPRAAKEVASITGLYPNAAVMEGGNVTASSVLDAIREADIVHYAGHTNSDTEAGLLLRADRERPGILYGAEVAATTLRAAPLVVLAGCRTLRGGSRRQDVDSSLARAFLLAGARSVVATIWNIDDGPASELFARFHEENASTGDSVAAVSKAQRFMLQHRKRHPSDWAFAQIVVRAL